MNINYCHIKFRKHCARNCQAFPNKINKIKDSFSILKFIPAKK